MQHNILEIKNLSKNFGGLAAVSDCSISIKKGSITGIIGPNGSGKTTLFNLIAGNLKSSSGNVIFDNEDITNVPSYELFSKGLLRTFQIAHEFSNLSVLENLMMVPANQSGENLINNFLNPKLIKREEKDIKEKAKQEQIKTEKEEIKKQQEMEKLKIDNFQPGEDTRRDNNTTEAEKEYVKQQAENIVKSGTERPTGTGQLLGSSFDRDKERTPSGKSYTQSKIEQAAKTGRYSGF